MALTTTLVNITDDGFGVRTATFNVAFDSSYAGSGGETFDISTWYQGSPTCVGTSNTAGYVVQHNNGTAAAGKLIVFEQDAGGVMGEVAGATDLSTSLAACKVTMRGAPAI